MHDPGESLNADIREPPVDVSATEYVAVSVAWLPSSVQSDLIWPPSRYAVSFCRSRESSEFVACRTPSPLANRRTRQSKTTTPRLKRTPAECRGITSGPNRRDDPECIVRLIGQVVRVRVETMAIVNTLPKVYGGPK